MLTNGWPAALVAATGVHAGFQLTVTLLVYPALGDVEPSRWGEVHVRHSRRIVPIVGVIYLGVLVTVVGSLIETFDLLTVVTAVASGLVLALTAFLAAPLHARLEGGRDAVIFRRLLRVDRLRSVLSVVALAAALAGGAG